MSTAVAQHVAFAATVITPACIMLGTANLIMAGVCAIDERNMRPVSPSAADRTGKLKRTLAKVGGMFMFAAAATYGSGAAVYNSLQPDRPTLNLFEVPAPRGI